MNAQTVRSIQYMCCQLFCFFFCCCCCFTPFFPVCLFMFLVSLLCRAVSAGAGGVLSLSLLHIGLAWLGFYSFVCFCNAALPATHRSRTMCHRLCLPQPNMNRIKKQKQQKRSVLLVLLLDKLHHV